MDATTTTNVQITRDATRVIFTKKAEQGRPSEGASAVASATASPRSKSLIRDIQNKSAKRSRVGRSQQLQTTQTLQQQQEHNKISFELTHETKALNQFIKFPDLRGVAANGRANDEASNLLESLKTSVLGELNTASGLQNIPTKGKHKNARSGQKKLGSTASQVDLASQANDSALRFPGLEESHRGSTTDRDRWSDSRQTGSHGAKIVRAIFNHSPERGYVDKNNHGVKDNTINVFDKISNRILDKVKDEQISQEVNELNDGVRRTLMNIEKLACSDQDMIRLQRKTIYIQQLEIQQHEKKMAALRRNYEKISRLYKEGQEQISSLQSRVDSFGSVERQLSRERDSIVEQNLEESGKSKRTISELNSRIKQLVNQMQKQDSVNASVLRSLSFIQENTHKSIGCQTPTSLLTPAFLRSIKSLTSKNRMIGTAVQDYRGQERVGSPGGTGVEYSRDTFGLGAKAITANNVAVQCNIKIAAAAYRALQKTEVELRAENRSLKDEIARQKQTYSTEIEVHQKELAELRAQLKKMQKQSYSAFEVLTKERERIQKRHIQLLMSEIESLKAQHSILSEKMGEEAVQQAIRNSSMQQHHQSSEQMLNLSSDQHPIQLNSERGARMAAPQHTMSDFKALQLTPLIEEVDVAMGGSSPLTPQMMAVGVDSAEVDLIGKNGGIAGAHTQAGDSRRNLVVRQNFIGEVYNPPVKGLLLEGQQVEILPRVKSPTHVKNDEPNADQFNAGQQTRQVSPDRSSYQKGQSGSVHTRGIGSQLQEEVRLTVEQQRHAFDGISMELLGLKRELEKERGKSDKLARELRQQQNKESEMKSELVDMTETISMLESTKSEMQEKIEKQSKAESELKGKQSEIDNLRRYMNKRVEGLEKEKQDLLDKITSNERMHNYLMQEEKTRMENKTQLLILYKEKKEKAEQESQNQRQENLAISRRHQEAIKDHESQVRVLRNSLTEKNSIIEDLNERKAKEDSKLRAKNQELYEQLKEVRADCEMKQLSLLTAKRERFKALREKDDQYYQMLMKMHLHISCLGCDEIKKDILTLQCGHNICRSCLNKYSSTEHHKASIRCEECCLETLVAHMNMKVPNRALTVEMLTIEKYIGRKFQAGAIVENKYSKPGPNEDEKSAYSYHSRTALEEPSKSSEEIKEDQFMVKMQSPTEADLNASTITFQKKSGVKKLQEAVDSLQNMIENNLP